MKRLLQMVSVIAILELFFLAVGLGISFINSAVVYADNHVQDFRPGIERTTTKPRTNVLRLVSSTPPTFTTNPLLSPLNATIVTTARPTFDWLDANNGVVSYTLWISGENGVFAQPLPVEITTTSSIYTPTQNLSNGVYTWTVQAHNEAGETSGYVAPYTFTVQVQWQVFLPLILKAPACPTVSIASFNLMPINGPFADHPDYLHGDLNLALRGYSPTTGILDLIDLGGNSDPSAPLLAGLFSPNQFPGITALYRVNHWNWGCGSHGCAGGPITSPWDVSLIGLSSFLWQPVFIPERSANIYGDFKAMVLYAEEKRITLGYTRDDTVANGYAVHLENVCIDPNLLALYRAQVDSNGWRKTGWLPGLRNNQQLGVSFGDEFRVAIRDRGTFMDPRSAKDWWE